LFGQTRCHLARKGWGKHPWRREPVGRKQRHPSNTVKGLGGGTGTCIHNREGGIKEERKEEWEGVTLNHAIWHHYYPFLRKKRQTGKGGLKRGLSKKKKKRRGS